ncbi:MAG: DUF1998 domain-containing protein [Actinobacteria bacterium]|nr:DUF1998 domain-containing protein [Actinomycetota bacterium]
MSKRAHGQVRRSQVITTWGPGALIDLPRHSGIVGGLETWPEVSELEEVPDQRLQRKLALVTGLPQPRLYLPPPDSNDPSATKLGIRVWRFPEWMMVQEKPSDRERVRSRRLVHRRMLDERGRFDGADVVPTRFVRACPRGHVDDLNWHGFVHDGNPECKGQLWLDERGTGGDLGDLTVRCQACEATRGMQDAAEYELFALGTCRGSRPWLGLHGTHQDCTLPARLLIRTAANAYFPQVVSALSLPDQAAGLDKLVGQHWDDLSIVESLEELQFVKKKPAIAAAFTGQDDADVLAAIARVRGGGTAERPVKQVELDALLAAPEGFGDDMPVDPNFHARRLPESFWRHSELSAPITAIVQLHRLREVLALIGFTRFEPVTPDVDGEYDGDVERADLALEPSWFPAVENRGEGIFLQVDPHRLGTWLQRPAVRDRLDQLRRGHDHWAQTRKNARAFPGGPYVLLHTLSHLLLQSLALRCGYPASSIRERIYVDTDGGRFGVLLYTASTDAEGTLGGLVGQARSIEAHLELALASGQLCSNDPICAQHEPGETLEGRYLHGAACHGCSLIAETSCEMRNDYLDRALVVPTLAVPDAALFAPVS